MSSSNIAFVLLLITLLSHLATINAWKKEDGQTPSASVHNESRNHKEDWPESLECSKQEAEKKNPNPPAQSYAPTQQNHRTNARSCTSASYQTETLMNIDCGARKGFTDSDYNLTWVGDDDYVKSGVIHKLTNATDAWKEETTLRAFPDKKMMKNCYTIPVSPKRRIQVRIGFRYGNYDGKEMPPSFMLFLDNNYWDSVLADMYETVHRLVIYFVERNFTDICLGRISDNEDPFVSFIQVVIYEPRMYEGVNSTIALYDPTNYALGANDGYFRHPDDVYDREWDQIDDDITISKYMDKSNHAKTINTSTCVDNPPAKLFTKAITPLTGSKNLTIITSFLGSYSYGLYLNLYFTETNPNLTRKRAFNIYKDDVLISNSSYPISPRFGEAIEFTYVIVEPQFRNTTRITLAPTHDSTAPPIISGIEAFRTDDFSFAWTNSSDVEALMTLQSQFIVLQEWTGDPCLPIDYNWNWTGCSDNETTPRITKLYLSGYDLTGKLPDFSGLTALEMIDLHNNSLSGSIPEFLGQFPNLKLLNLAYNNFTSIPPSLYKKNNMTLNVTGNPLRDRGLVASPPMEQGADAEPPSNPNGSIVISTISLFYFVLLVIVGVF